MDYAGPVFGLCFRAALLAQRVTLGWFLCCFSYCQRHLRGLRWAGVWAVFPRGQRHPSRLRWAGLWREPGVAWGCLGLPALPGAAWVCLGLNVDR